jgi:hypothetical protein
MDARDTAVRALLAADARPVVDADAPDGAEIRQPAVAREPSASTSGLPAVAREIPPQLASMRSHSVGHSYSGSDRGPCSAPFSASQPQLHLPQLASSSNGVACAERVSERAAGVGLSRVSLPPQLSRVSLPHPSAVSSYRGPSASLCPGQQYAGSGSIDIGSSTDEGSRYSGLNQDVSVSALPASTPFAIGGLHTAAQAPWPCAAGAARPDHHRPDHPHHVHAHR